jgi:hypothetical protein
VICAFISLLDRFCDSTFAYFPGSSECPSIPLILLRDRRLQQFARSIFLFFSATSLTTTFTLTTTKKRGPG